MFCIATNSPKASISNARTVSDLGDTLHTFGDCNVGFIYYVINKKE